MKQLQKTKKVYLLVSILLLAIIIPLASSLAPWYIELQVIDDGVNNTVVRNTTFNVSWARTANTSQYHLQIANDSSFSDSSLILNISDINIFTYPTLCSQNDTSVTFLVEDIISEYDKYYTRVRAYTDLEAGEEPPPSYSFPEYDYDFPEYDDNLHFGMITDIHALISNYDNFITAMNSWDTSTNNVSFIMDLGDFATQTASMPTTQAKIDAQRARAIDFYDNHATNADMLTLFTIGNHDCGFKFAGYNYSDEYNTVDDDQMIEWYDEHHMEHLYKKNLTEILHIPHKYYAWSINANNVWYRFYVLDGNCWTCGQYDWSTCGVIDLPEAEKHDSSLEELYWIDENQTEMLYADMAEHPSHKKIIFCHEELWSSLPLSYRSFVSNGWRVRENLTADGNVLAVFAGHHHDNYYMEEGGVHYVTLYHGQSGSYSKVTISSTQIFITGVGSQSSYVLDI